MAKLMVFRENPGKCPSLAKNPRKCSTALGLRWTLLSNTATKLMICRENPAKCPSLAKNPPKYTTAYIVQESNCRWHCEPTFFLSWAFNKEKSIHTLPLQSFHLLSLPLWSLPLQTLRLVSLVSLITKTERIAQRSATMTGIWQEYDRTTDRMTDRGS
jgi:hypothetical protein